jgi:hypothetical protein
MRSRIQVTNDGARSAFFVRLDDFHVNAQPAQRLRDVLSISATHESCQDNITSKLSVNTRGIAALAAGLNQYPATALNLSYFEVIDLKNAVDGEVGAHDKEHATFYWNLMSRRLDINPIVAKHVAAGFQPAFNYKQKLL